MDLRPHRNQLCNRSPTERRAGGEDEAELYDSGRKTNLQFKYGGISVLMTQYLSNQKLGECAELRRSHCHCRLVRRVNYLPCVRTLAAHFKCILINSEFTEIHEVLRVYAQMNGSTPSTSSPKPAQTNNKLADYYFARAFIIRASRLNEFRQHFCNDDDDNS